MSWSAPMTAVANSVFTAAQFNQYVRDNLNATAVALATAAGQYFVATGTNALAARSPASATVTTTETTTSTAYADLTTPGPQVTVTTGTTALVIVYGNVANSATSTSFISYALSGATTFAGADARSASGNFGSSGNACLTGAWLESGLTAGSNTFKCVYRVSGGTGTFHDRKIAVFPFS